MIPAGWNRLLPALAWAAYLLIPNDAGGLIDGLPLGPIEAAAVLTLGWLVLFGERLRLGLPVAIAAMITVTAAAAIPGSPGFRARYFANAEGTGVAERSVEFINSPFTRIDRRLHFVPGGPELPLNFFNDHTRYSLFQVAYTRHDQLPFAVRWSGDFWARAGIDAIYLQAPRASAQVFVDGNEVASVTADDGEAVVPVSLDEGWHRLDIVLSSPFGGARQFAAGTVRSGERIPFDARDVMTQRVRSWQVTAARALRLARTAIDISVLTVLFVTFVIAVTGRFRSLFQSTTADERLRHVLALFVAVGAIDALRAAAPWADRVMLLVAGDDTATYETYAREILLNSVLMTSGKPLGEGDPFYYQAFYPYFLAFEHLVGGEFMFGVVLVQRLLCVYAVVKLVEIAVRLTNPRAWIVALPIAAGFVAWKFWPIASQPLNESLYVPLLVGSVAALIRLCDAPGTRRAVIAGALCGVTTITRTTALLGWAMASLPSWMSIRRHPSRVRLVLLMAAAFLTVLSLITIRNAIVAHVFAPMPTELGITLLGGNEPPAGFTIDPGRAEIYKRFDIDDLTATVIDYAIAEPRLFAANLINKALFVLGFYERYAPGWGYSPVYIATWISALAGGWLAIRNRTAHVWPMLIPAIVALTQFIAIVVIYPKGERLVVPVHTLLIPYSAAAAWFAVNRRSSEAANVNLMASRTST